MAGTASEIRQKVKHRLKEKNLISGYGEMAYFSMK